MSKQKHELIIDGRKYTLFSERSDIDHLYLSVLQSRLEEKIANFRKTSGVVDTASLMVLVAIDSIDESEQIKNKVELKEQQLRHKIQNLIQLCDDVLA